MALTQPLIRQILADRHLPAGTIKRGGDDEWLVIGQAVRTIEDVERFADSLADEVRGDIQRYERYKRAKGQEPPQSS